MKNIFVLIVSASALLVTGCGSIKTKERLVEETKTIHKAALVGFTADLPAANKIGFDLGSGKAAGKAGGSMLNQTSSETDEMMKTVSREFGTRLKWTMLDPDRMLAMPKYQEAYKKTMEGFHNRMPPGAGVNRFVVEKMMDADSIRIMEIPDRENFLKEMKVDALVVARVNVLTTGTTVMGIGSRHPQAQVFFEVFKAGHERPIWWETLEGKEMEESIGKTGLTIDEKKAAQLGLVSLKDGLSKLQ